MVKDWDEEKERESNRIDAALASLLDPIKPERISPYWSAPIYKSTLNSKQVVIKYVLNSQENLIKDVINTELSEISPAILDIKDFEKGMFITYESASGEGYFSIYTKLNLEEQSNLFMKMGEVLAKCHNIATTHLQIKPKDKLHRKEFKFISSALREIVLKHIDKTDALIQKKAIFTHGDFGPQQFLISNNEIKLIDWECIRLSMVEEDVGWFFWTTYSHFENYKNLISSFKKGYLKYRSLNFDPKVIQSFAVSKIWEVMPKFDEMPHEDIKAIWAGKLEKSTTKEFLDAIS